MSQNFSTLNPQQGDGIRILEAMILLAINGGGGGGGGGGGLSGTGAPEGVVTASPGTTYLDISGNHFWAKNNGTGNTGWVELIA